MTPILILEAFGHLSATDQIESERERERREWIDPSKGAVQTGILHRIFEARAELMGWATYDNPPLHPPLWNMFEAGLTDSEDDPSLIGWVHVGLANPIDLMKAMPEFRTAPRLPEQELRDLRETLPAGDRGGWATIPMPPGYNEATVELCVALTPLVQCLDDALRRIGAVEVSGFQLTCYGAHYRPRGQSSARHRFSGDDWFDVPSQSGADALIAFDRGFLGGHTEAELAASLRRTVFEFGSPVAVTERHKAKGASATPWPNIILEPSGLGVPVSMPEWTASAAAWALTGVINEARDFAPDVENFAVRITRVQ